MKRVTINNLRVENFKGIKSFEHDFTNNVIVKGDNGTGKSSIFADAIPWCLFGKNGQNKTDFSIKNTVDTTLNRGDHTVIVNMIAGDEQIQAKKVYREKWVKQRGSEEATFKGHESEHFWNNVPCTEKEYQAKVSGVIEESIFKLLTNPLYFNVNLSETDRRDTLVRMSGDISNEKVINGTPMYHELFAKIKGQKTLEEYRKELSYERTGLKKALLEIPIRIDEIIKRQPKAEDWSAIQAEIATKEQSIKDIEAEITGITSGLDEQNKAIQNIQQEVYNANRKMREIENRLKGEAENEASKKNMEINQAINDLTSVRRALISLQNEKARLEDEIKQKQNEVTTLRDKWGKVNAEIFTFDESKCTCYACNQKLPDADPDKAKADQYSVFTSDKNLRLDNISTYGQSLNGRIEDLNARITEINQQHDELAKKEEALLEISARPKYVADDVTKLLDQDKEFQEALKIANQAIPKVVIPDVADQREMIKVLSEGIGNLKNLLFNKGLIEQGISRINDLKAEEKRYSKDLADLERNIFTIDSFQKHKMELVEQAINSRFKIVKFKLFKKNVTNDGEEPCCIAMVNGVPFADLNRAGQINAGIDIINALSEFYGVSAPLIFDNAEAVTEFLETDSQLIKLYVEKGKALEVSCN